VLLTPDGAPKVSDFGLAKLLDLGVGPTASGEVLGTPSYMAPEQAQSKGQVIGPATDVHALGAILYELLTGRPPFRAATAMETVFQVIREEPVPPRLLQSATPRDLETICLKCLQKDPRRRYPSAAVLADDLKRFLANEPILARPVGRAERVWRWCRRRPAVAGLLAALVLALTVLAGVIGWVGRDRAARQAALETQVNYSLGEARRWQYQGKWRQGQATLQHIELLLTDTDDTDPLWTGCRRLRRDLKMLERLEEARLSQTAVKEEHFDIRVADFLYAEAFAEYDLRVLSLGRHEAARRVASSAIAKELVAALIDWGNVTANHAAGSKIRTIARLAERDPRRQEFLKALCRRDWPGLVAVGKKRGILDQPSATLALLGQAMALADVPAAMEFLRRARRRYPGDFWINHQLGRAQSDLKPPRLEEAIASFRAAVASNPDSPGAHLNLGIALKAKGDLDEAIAEYRQATDLKSDYVAPHLSLGNALHKKRLLDEAIAEYRKAIALKPALAAAHSNLGRTLSDKGLVDEAIAEFHLALRWDRKSAMAHNNIGIALAGKGRVEEAIAEFRKAIRINPQIPDTHLNLGNALKNRGGLDEAIAAYHRAVKLKPHYAEAYYGLGIALRARGRRDDAMTAYRHAIRWRPGYAEAHVNLGNILAAKGRLDEALGHFRQAVRSKPNLPQAHACLGSALRQKGRLDEAITQFQEGIRLKPNLPGLHTHLGDLFRSRGRLDEAIAEYEAAIRLKPDDAGAHCGLGIVWSDGKREYDRAIAEFKEVIRLKPDSFVAHVGLGITLRRKGMLPQAIAAYRRGLRLRPDHASLRCNLAALLRQAGKVNEAIREYKEAIRRQPNSVSAHNDLGAILCDDKGDYDGAILAFRQTLRLRPDYAPAHAGLGTALQHKRQLKEAVAHFRKAIRLKPKQAFGYAGLAWLLATAPDPKFRDPRRAVELANQAVALGPREAGPWNTLGVAHYRVGDWSAAIAALGKSMKLGKGGNSADWFFLAMGHWQRGEKEKARRWHRRAVRDMEKTPAQFANAEELRRFRAEAAALLGEPLPAPAKSAAGKR
jgi:tetratricopeptide (TPR) repeat protein